MIHRRAHSQKRGQHELDDSQEVLYAQGASRTMRCPTKNSRACKPCVLSYYLYSYGGKRKFSILFSQFGCWSHESTALYPPAYCTRCRVFTPGLEQIGFVLGAQGICPAYA
jgi:hypothetical protein